MGDLTDIFRITFSLYIGMELEITSTDLEFVKEVMIKQFSNFSDRPVSVNFFIRIISFFKLNPFSRGYPMEENLLMVPKYYAPRGYGWKEIRSIVSPVFTTGKIKQVWKTIRRLLGDAPGHPIKDARGAPPGL